MGLREWIIDWQVTRTQAATAPNPLSPLVLNPLSPNLIQMSSAEPSQLISPTTTATVPESIIGRASVFSPVNVPQQTFQFNPPRPSNRFEDMSCNELSNWAGNIPGFTTKGREKIAQYFKKENLSGFVICRMGGNFEIIRTSLDLCLGDFMYLQNALVEEIQNNAQSMRDGNEELLFSVPNSGFSS